MSAFTVTGAVSVTVTVTGTVAVPVPDTVNATVTVTFTVTVCCCWSCIDGKAIAGGELPYLTSHHSDGRELFPESGDGVSGAGGAVVPEHSACLLQPVDQANNILHGRRTWSLPTR